MNDFRRETTRFPAANRLKTPREFQQVFAENLRIKGAYVTLLARNNDLNIARLGLAVAKKHLKRAVHRNTLKRVIRESFRAQKQRLAGYDIVVLTTPRAVNVSQQAHRAAIDKQWLKLPLLNRSAENQRSHPHSLPV